MTHEEMAAALRAAGWYVRSPISQATCPHWGAISNGWLAADGSSRTSGYCSRCGKHWTREYVGARATVDAIVNLLR